MACPMCQHTMQNVGHASVPGRPTFWCPRCGTIKIIAGHTSNDDVEAPSAIKRAGIPVKALEAGVVKELVAAAEMVLGDLNARIDNAPANAVPVFRGIAELYTALGKIKATASSPRAEGE